LCELQGKKKKRKEKKKKKRNTEAKQPKKADYDPQILQFSQSQRFCSQRVIVFVGWAVVHQATWSLFTAKVKKKNHIKNPFKFTTWSGHKRGLT